jgi:hypothetical protein
LIYQFCTNLCINFNFVLTYAYINFVQPPANSAYYIPSRLQKKKLENSNLESTYNGKRKKKSNKVCCYYDTPVQHLKAYKCFINHKYIQPRVKPVSGTSAAHSLTNTINICNFLGKHKWNQQKGSTSRNNKQKQMQWAVWIQ